MKVSLILTVHDRSPEVSRAVADSFHLPGNRPDEVVVVLDRCTPEAREGARAAWDCLEYPVRFITIPGEPAWKSPVKAWNFGFAAATGDVFYCASSETVQAEGNVHRAKELLRSSQVLAEGEGLSRDGTSEPIHHKGIVLHGKAECSCGPAGQEVNWGGAAPGNLLCDAAHPRPLGFIWAAPAWAVRKIGGYDEAFDRGLWYDDNDFFLRLWQTGLDFLFTDQIHGTHLHHDRAGLNEKAIAVNRETMLQKHGRLDPWPTLPRTEERREGKTMWRHL